MSNRTSLLLSALLLAVMLSASLWGLIHIPDDARLAVHWGGNGQANGFAGKSEALWMLPVLALGLTVFLALLPRIEPRRAREIATFPLYHVVWIGVLALLALAHALILLQGLGGTGFPVWLPTVGCGGLMLLIGNYLGKTRPNFFIGMRTPWSLSSDYAWDKTNRLTGRLLFLTGAVTLLLAPWPMLAIRCLLAGCIASAVVGVLASYFFWRRDPSRHP